MERRQGPSGERAFFLTRAPSCGLLTVAERKVQQVGHDGGTEAVKHLLTDAAALDQTAPAQEHEVMADALLRDPRSRDDTPHRHFTLGLQETKDAQPGLIGEQMEDSGRLGQGVVVCWRHCHAGWMPPRQKGFGAGRTQVPQARRRSSRTNGVLIR
jgi:hypothetical protein